MIAKSAAYLAFAAVCLTAIATSPAAYAQMGYWPPPSPHGPPPASMAMAPHQALMALRRAPMGQHRGPMHRTAGMYRRWLDPR